MTWVDFAIEFIIPLLCAAITYYVIPILKEKNLYNYVRIGVHAAEQLFRDSGMGREKFDYVKKWVNEKFKISDQDLENMIEAIVFEMNKDIN